MEYFDVVDKNDKVIGKAARNECHSNPKLIHRAVYVLVVKGNNILLQKRSMEKDTSAGKWDISSSGHNDIGETYEKAAKRELKEELGLKLPLKSLGKLLVPMKMETEIDVMFVAKIGKENINFNKEEIEEVKFFTLDEIKAMPKEQFTECFWTIMNFYIDKYSF